MGHAVLRPSWGYLALLGLALTVFASIINFQVASFAVDLWLRGYIASHGHAGVTSTDLGLFLGNLLVFPMLLGIHLVIVLPLVWTSWPDLLQSNLGPALAFALPVLGIGVIWFSPNALFWAMTLPAVLCCAAAVATEIWLARSGER